MSSSSPDGSATQPPIIAACPSVVQSLLQSGDIGVALVGPAATVEWVNEPLETYFGLEAGTVTGECYESFVETHLGPSLANPDSVPASLDSADRGGSDRPELHVLSGDGRPERRLRYHVHPIASGPASGGHLLQFTDITAERPGTETTPARKSRTEEFLCDIQSMAEVGGWEVDLRSDTLRWTDEVYRIHGLPTEYEPTVSDALAFYHPEDRADVTAAFERLTTEGEAFDLELRIVTDDDEVRWVRALGRPWRDHDGDQIGARGAVQDITDRKSRERELRRKSRALDAAPVGISITDPSQDDNPMIYINETFEALTGYDRDAALGRNCRFLQGEATDPETVAEIRAAVDAAEPLSTELRNYRQDGTEFWNRLELAPVRDDAGEVVNYVGFQQDVTERVVRERELSESRNRYRTLIESFPNGAVALVDRDLRYTTVGGTPIDIAETTARELQGEKLTAALPTDLADLLVPHYRAALEGEDRSFSGAIGGREYRFRIVPVTDDDGDVFAAMGVSQDVTDEMARERELRETKQRLDVALEETDTGVWVLDDEAETVTAFGTTTELFNVDSSTDNVEAYLDSIHPEDRPAVEAALKRSRSDGARFDTEFRVETEGRDRWVRGRGKYIDKPDGTGKQMVGVTTDVSERKHRIRALERRERILRELHTATRDFYPPRSMADIASFLVEFIDNALGLSYISVREFDEETGTLRPSVWSDDLAAGDAGLEPVPPGDNPVWQAYRDGETTVFTAAELGGFAETFDASITQLLVAPVGDFGVTLAATTDGRRFDQMHIDIIDVLVANGESAFQRLRSDGVRSEIVAELSAQQARVEELQGLVDTIQSVQHRLGESDSREMLESGVCQELTATDRIDFAWIGRPRGSETNIAPVAWAGDADGYVDTTLAGEATSALPAVRAARDRDPVSVPKISSHVLGEPWAKDALSYSFSSVLSTPLVYDDVLYGVLTVYSCTEDAFDTLYDNFVTDVATLLVNYSRILEQREAGSQQRHTTLEFELTGQTYPLQRLANATDSTVQFDTIAEHTSDAVRILATVLAGDAEAVLDHAQSMASIDTASWFGSADHRQLSLTVRKPFLATLVGKHGGRLVETVSKPDATTVTIELPDSVSNRPLLDSLTSRYDRIELVAQRHSADPAVGGRADLTDVLTERQSEILNAAYHGGYYETPRGVTGEDLAVSFDISSPAVYNHLQAAHRRILRTVLDGAGD